MTDITMGTAHTKTVQLATGVCSWLVGQLLVDNIDQLWLNDWTDSGNLWNEVCLSHYIR